VDQKYRNSLKIIAASEPKDLGFDAAIQKGGLKPKNSSCNLKFLGSDAAFIFKELRYSKQNLLKS
jgi:hypothetical protein